MGLRFRRTITIAKGIRLNVGKKSAGISFGTRGLRYSINSSGRKTATAGLPGTGLSYSKTVSGGRRRQTANQQVRRYAEQQRKQQQIRQNSAAVDEFNELVETIKGVHKVCDELVDWHHIYSLPAPFTPPSAGPNETRATQEFEHYSPNLLQKMFPSLRAKKEQNLQIAIAQAKRRDEEDYTEWQSLNELSGKIVGGDIDAYLQVIEEMRPLDDLLELGSDFEFGTDDASYVEVEFRVKSEAVVPRETLSLTKTGKLSKKEMTKTEYFALVQDYVSSCSIRIARDVSAILPVRQVIVHAVDQMLNTTTGYYEDVTILSVAFDIGRLNTLNFEQIDPSDALQNFRHHMKFAKTSGFKPVERLMAYIEV